MKYLKIETQKNKHVEIPVNIIAEDRANYYVNKYQRSFDQSYDESISAFNDYECLVEYWATKKMKWKEINSILKNLYQISLDQNEWLASRKQIVKH